MPPLFGGKMPSTAPAYRCLSCRRAGHRDGLRRPFESSIESLNCLFGAPGKHVVNRLKVEQQTMETLQ